MEMIVVWELGEAMSVHAGNDFPSQACLGFDRCMYVDTYLGQFITGLLTLCKTEVFELIILSWTFMGRG